MADEQTALLRLGEALRTEVQDLLSGYVRGWTAPAAVPDDWRELALLEAALGTLAGLDDELAALERALIPGLPSGSAPDRATQPAEELAPAQPDAGAAPALQAQPWPGEQAARRRVATATEHPGASGRFVQARQERRASDAPHPGEMGPAQHDWPDPPASDGRDSSPHARLPASPLRQPRRQAGGAAEQAPGAPATSPRPHTPQAPPAAGAPAWESLRIGGLSDFAGALRGQQPGLGQAGIGAAEPRGTPGASQPAGTSGSVEQPSAGLPWQTGPGWAEAGELAPAPEASQRWISADAAADAGSGAARTPALGAQATPRAAGQSGADGKPRATGEQQRSRETRQAGVDGAAHTAGAQHMDQLPASSIGHVGEEPFDATPVAERSPTPRSSGWEPGWGEQPGFPFATPEEPPLGVSNPQLREAPPSAVQTPGPPAVGRPADHAGTWGIQEQTAPQEPPLRDSARPAYAGTPLEQPSLFASQAIEAEQLFRLIGEELRRQYRRYYEG